MTKTMDRKSIFLHIIRDNVLDLKFCSQFLMHSCVSYLPPFNSSDHSSLELGYRFFKQVNCMSNNIDYYYDFSHGDYENFNMYINSIRPNWLNLLNSIGEIGDMLDNFMHIFSIGLDKFILIRVKTCHPNYKKYPAYIKRIQADKRRLWRNRKDPGVVAKYHKVCIRYKSAVGKFCVRQETELIKYRLIQKLL